MSHCIYLFWPTLVDNHFLIEKELSSFFPCTSKRFPNYFATNMETRWRLIVHWGHKLEKVPITRRKDNPLDCFFIWPNKANSWIRRSPKYVCCFSWLSNQTTLTQGCCIFPVMLKKEEEESRERRLELLEIKPKVQLIKLCSLSCHSQVARKASLGNCDNYFG